MMPCNSTRAFRTTAHVVAPASHVTSARPPHVTPHRLHEDAGLVALVIPHVTPHRLLHEAAPPAPSRFTRGWATCAPYPLLLSRFLIEPLSSSSSSMPGLSTRAPARSPAPNKKQTAEYLLVNLALDIAVAVDFVVSAKRHRHVGAHRESHLSLFAHAGVERSRERCIAPRQPSPVSIPHHGQSPDFCKSGPASYHARTLQGISPPCRAHTTSPTYQTCPARTCQRW